MSGGEARRLLTLYCPLWGVATSDDPAELGGDGCGLVGGKVLATTPYDDEWRAIQQSDVYRLRLAAAAGAPRAPLCLTIFEPLRAEETFDEGVARAGDTMLASARDAVLALRLAKAGWFLDPELAEVAFAVMADGRFQRRPGPYRQAFLAGVDVPAAYCATELRLADLTTLERRGPVTRVFDMLAAYRAAGGNGSADIASESFLRSFGYQLAGAQRAAALFTALDAMLGGMSARRIGRVALRPRYFRRRVEAALNVVDDPSLDAETEALWLDSQGGGRGLRNAIAHGDAGAIGPDADPSALRLQALVRALLPQYVAFAIRWAEGSASIVEGFRLPPGCSFAAAYNKILEALARGDAGARELLRAF